MTKFKFNDKGMDDFMKKVQKEVKETALNASYDYTCPNCGTTFKAKVGENICPSCSTKIDLEPDSSWDKL